MIKEYLTEDLSGSELVSIDSPAFWRVFQHGSIEANGIRVHYVSGGSGPSVLLIPGWPQSWYAWRHVMSGLVGAGRRVIAIDPRGIGDSDHPASGYDMTTVAKDIHCVIDLLALNESGPVDIVGHDIGAWMAYALASDWPSDVKRLAIFDAALPGISPLVSGIPSEEQNAKTWHFAFNRLDDLPEILIKGKEREFLTWLFETKSCKEWAFSKNDIDEYVRVNQLPGALSAALNYYRTAFSVAAIEENKARATTRLSIPVLAFGGESGVGGTLVATMRKLADDVRGGVLDGVGHYLPEECPHEMVMQLTAFFDET